MASAGSLSRENNFNLLRFVAATAVLFSHSSCRMEESRPVYVLTEQWDAADIGAVVFFVISGCLVRKASCNGAICGFFRSPLSQPICTS